MKTRVSTTSIEAYRALHDLSARQRQVYEMLAIRDMSHFELGKALDLDVFSITGRTDELCKMNLIEFKGKRLCPYRKRNVKYWGLVPKDAPGRSLDLFPRSNEVINDAR